jgi:hypothetical protein
MLTQQILALLTTERDKLTRAIEALQGQTKRRGRPPRNPLVGVTVSAATPEPTRKKRTFTAAQRKQQAERMRAYWAAKRKTEVKSQPSASGKAKKSAKAAA